MANADHLVLAIGVGALLTVVLFGALLPGPAAEEPEDPFRDLVFSMQRSQYTFGENATLVLRNEGNLTFERHFWGVQRFVDGEWAGVECHSQYTVIFNLHPGEQWYWRWTVESADPSRCIGLDGKPLPPVEEGLYRGFVALRHSSDLRRSLFAEFVVV